MSRRMSRKMDRRMRGGPGRHVVRDAAAAALAGLKYAFLAGVLSIVLFAVLFGSRGTWRAADAQEQGRIVVECVCGGALAVLPLLYGRMRAKKRLAPGAFSVKGLTAYAPVLAAVGVGGLLGAAAAVVQAGSLRLLAQLAAPRQLVSAAILALFSVLMNEGRMIACLKERGYAQEEIIRMLAGAELVVFVGNLLLKLANGGGLDVAAYGISGLYALLTVVLCGRAALRSGRLTEACVLRLMLLLTNGLGTLSAAMAVQAAALAAAILLLGRTAAKTA